MRNLSDWLSKWLPHLAFPPATRKISSWSTSLVTLGMVILFYFNHYNNCVVESHGGVNLCPSWWIMWDTSLCTYWPFMSLLCELSIQIICPFFFIGHFVFLLLNRKSSLYIVSTNSLSDLCFVNFIFRLWLAFLLFHYYLKSRCFQFW